MINQKLMMLFWFIQPVKSGDNQLEALLDIAAEQLSQRCVANTNCPFLLLTKLVNIDIKLAIFMYFLPCFFLLLIAH